MQLLHHFPPSSPPQTADTAAQWRALWPALGNLNLAPFDLAVRAGLAADRLAWAFGGGYQAAIRALQPQLLRGADTGSLCATEASGNRPRDIQSAVRQAADGSLHLAGSKRWSTMSPVASLLFVLARDERDASADDRTRPALKLLRVPANAPGVTIRAMPATAFTPELPHAEISFDNVPLQAADVLPGDGWSDHVKPFRTLEDIFVSAACLAHLVRVAHAEAWPRAVVEDSLNALCALQTLASQAPSSPAVHLALAGTLRTITQVYAAIDAHCAQAPASAANLAWQRDRSLFGIAGKTRDLRTERAWAQLGA